MTERSEHMADAAPFTIEELVANEPVATSSCSGTCKGMGSTCCVAFDARASEGSAVDDLEELARTED